MNRFIEKLSAFALAGALCASAGGCGSDSPRSDVPGELPELPDPGNIHTFKAPLYWSVYEYCYEQERAGVSNDRMDILPSEWDNILDWLARDLKPYGYDMVCTDGWIPMLAKEGSPYMTHYGSTAIRDLVAKARSRGMRVGVYDNPMWIHCSDETLIPGTSLRVGSLLYERGDKTMNPDKEDLWFRWALANRVGAREWIDGFFRHYHDLGVEFIRMDFLSWYEDGRDRGMGITGRGYGRENYERCLAYIAEAAKKYGIFTSLVMPHLYYNAELEARYGNMVRIVADTATGGWRHVSADNRGKSFVNWPNCMNQFDGFTYWSSITGRGKVIADGDFLRLNTLADDGEKQTAVTLQIMAGGPVAIADQRTTIGENTKFYANRELLELNADGFCGKPMGTTLGSAASQVWHGTMSDGTPVVAVFNRNDSPRDYSVKFADLGYEGEYTLRDLWLHAETGKAEGLSGTLAPHACRVVRLSR